MEYKIDPELAGLHRPLSKAEFEQLEQNCIDDGLITDPIKVWGEFILDGIHRLKIANEHDLEYDVVEISLPDKEAARAWVVRNQLGKRNISDHESHRLRAELIKLTGDTALVAEESGVSRRTVQRDKAAMEARDKMSPDILARCEDGSIMNHRRDWERYNELSDDQRKAVDQSLREHPELTLRQAIPDVKVSLKPEDFALINDCDAFSVQQKQSLSLGTLHCDSESLRQMLELPAETQILVAEVLNDEEVSSLSVAIAAVVTGPVEKEERKKKLSRLWQRWTKNLASLKAVLEDMKTIDPGWAPYAKAKKAIEQAESEWING